MTIGDLGIVRDVTIDADGRVEVTLTPTYSGCPATEVIRADVLAALSAAGFDEV
ncbi:MAG: ring,2-phenylacetyl-CoA epoxidase subunit PaaD, partial [Actinomycetota bacterium]|nr:ring,2-phenylacetyl-CoA epoxidase subunit PaaD [Actinomycetota bacterium]